MKPYGDQFWLGVDADGGIRERIEALAYAVQLGMMDPWSHEFVAQLVRDLPHANAQGADMLEVQRVFDEFKKRVRYTFHPSMDRIQTMRKTLEWGVGDCDNAAVALSTALSLLNFQTAWIVMAGDSGFYEHIWPQVWLPRDVPVDSPGGRWVDMELTSGPDNTPYTSHLGWCVPPNRRAFWRRFRLRPV